MEVEAIAVDGFYRELSQVPRFLFEIFNDTSA
jgi:hypothetical protein